MTDMSKKSSGEALSLETVTVPTPGQFSQDEEKAVPDEGAASQEHIHPDGGLRAWMTVAGAWWISSICFGYANAFGVYQAYYVEELLPSYSTSAISWIGSLQAFFLYATGIIAGPLFDHGYCRHMLIAGSVLYVGCVFAQAQAQQDAYYQIFLSQGLGQGFAMGLLYLPGMGVIMQYFQKRRAVAIGIAFTGSSIGGIIFPIMVNNIFSNVGYKWGVRAAGFYILGACILANLLIIPYYPPKHHKKPPRPSLAKLVTDPPYIVSTLGALLIGFGLYFYIQLFTLTRGGMSEDFSFYTLAIVNGASVFGRTLPNILADKLGISPVLLVLTYIAGGIVFAMFGLKDVGGTVIFCILYGFATGAYVSMTGPFFASMADHLSEMGVRMGLALALVGVAALVGTPIDGALLGSGPDYNWSRAIVFTSVMMLGGSVVMTFGAWLLAKKRGHWV
ncbi:MFS general substrate transporter [Calocera viscosa TUFC12733]|uniref:MFS general substrate transporter n=1 Tax=Calocera viscosa (strain TUFC12733) TaxID=1330018 RepID=A0A167REU1_CALVF|nr:MFS general substrate transporter [Calocera viscosa TUFC12733]